MYRPPSPPPTRVHVPPLCIQLLSFFIGCTKDYVNTIDRVTQWTHPTHRAPSANLHAGSSGHGSVQALNYPVRRSSSVSRPSHPSSVSSSSSAPAATTLSAVAPTHPSRRQPAPPPHPATINPTMTSSGRDHADSVSDSEEDSGNVSGGSRRNRRPGERAMRVLLPQSRSVESPSERKSEGGEGGDGGGSTRGIPAPSGGTVSANTSTSAGRGGGGSGEEGRCERRRSSRGVGRASRVRPSSSDDSLTRSLPPNWEQTVTKEGRTGEC